MYTSIIQSSFHSARVLLLPTELYSTSSYFSNFTFGITASTAKYHLGNVVLQSTTSKPFSSKIDWWNTFFLNKESEILVKSLYSLQNQGSHWLNETKEERKAVLCLMMKGENVKESTGTGVLLQSRYMATPIIQEWEERKIQCMERDCVGKKTLPKI